MSHVRKLVRDNIVTTVTGLTTTASRVYKTRIYPLETGKLPGLCVYTKSETSEMQTMTIPRTQMRVLDVMVEAYVQGTDDALDTIAVEVEEALATDVTRGGYAKDTEVVDFEADFSGEGEKPFSVGRFTVRVTYMTVENDVETAV